MGESDWGIGETLGIISEIWGKLGRILGVSEIGGGVGEDLGILEIGGGFLGVSEIG
jgi:hypothetical protein